jgi:aspartyl-tRNA synthetase
MSFITKPLRKLTGSLRSQSPSNLQNKEEGFHSSDSSTLNGNTPLDGNSTPTPKSRQLLGKEKIRQSVDRERSKAEAKKRQSMRRIESELFMRDAPPELTKLYKPYSMIMSKRRNYENRVLFKDLDFESTQPDYPNRRTTIDGIL